MKDAQHREEDLENRLSTNEKKAEAISDSSNSDDEDIPERTIDQLKNAFESGVSSIFRNPNGNRLYLIRELVLNYKLS